MSEILKNLHTIGVDQIYYEKFGIEAVENGVRSERATEFLEEMTRPINYGDRSNWAVNAELEREISSATMRALKRFFPDKSA